MCRCPTPPWTCCGRPRSYVRPNELDGPVFPGGKSTAGLSDEAIRGVLRRMHRSDLTVHGFRSTFRDWASETTNYQREVVEAALAHTVGDKTEAAYRRGDLFEKRRRLMNDWAAFCGRVEPAATARSLGLDPRHERRAKAHRPNRRGCCRRLAARPVANGNGSRPRPINSPLKN